MYVYMHTLTHKYLVGRILHILKASHFTTGKNALATQHVTRKAA